MILSKAKIEINFMIHNILNKYNLNTLCVVHFLDQCENSHGSRNSTQKFCENAYFAGVQTDYYIAIGFYWHRNIDK